MKRLLIFCFLLSAFCFSAVSQEFMQNRRKAFQPVVTASDYIIEENFEGTGAPTGWAASSGTPNYDYTTSPAPLQGLQSLFVNTAGATNGFSTLNDAWIYAKVYITNVSSSSFIGLYYNTTLAAAYRMTANLNGRIYSGTSFNVVTGTGLSTNTVYHIWIRGVKGTGANSSTYIYWSTDGVRPGSPNLSKTDGDNTTGFNRVLINSDAGATCTIADRVLVDDSAIGDNP